MFLFALGRKKQRRGRVLIGNHFFGIHTNQKWANWFSLAMVYVGRMRWVKHWQANNRMSNLHIKHSWKGNGMGDCAS
jgi:hypothetical protein